jgi:L-fuconolactonase
MFGSDWPVCLLAGTYQSGLVDYIHDPPIAEQEKVFGLTATSFYGLKISRHEPAITR